MGADNYATAADLVSRAGVLLRNEASHADLGAVRPGIPLRGRGRAGPDGGVPAAECVGRGKHESLRERGPRCQAAGRDKPTA